MLLSAMFLWAWQAAIFGKQIGYSETVPAEESRETDGGGKRNPSPGNMTTLNFSSATPAGIDYPPVRRQKKKNQFSYNHDPVR